MATKKSEVEVWLRGPVEGIPPLLQGVAHALLQAREEVTELMQDFPETLLWEKPAGVASVGFHLRHLTGVLDRLFTYARGEALTSEQLEYLRAEETSDEVSVEALLESFSQKVDEVLAKLSETDEKTLLEARGVGRAQLPSTKLGLFVHAAEHSQRHVGQLLVTVSVLTNDG